MMTNLGVPLDSSASSISSLEEERMEKRGRSLPLFERSRMKEVKRPRNKSRIRRFEGTTKDVIDRNLLVRLYPINRD